MYVYDLYLWCIKNGVIISIINIICINDFIC